MSNINNHRVDMNNKQIKDLYSIEAVQDLSHEAAATISGGGSGNVFFSLVFVDKVDGTGGAGRVVFESPGPTAQRSLGRFNNKASLYQLSSKRDIIVYTGEDFTGKSRLLRAGRPRRLTGVFNNNIESFQVV